jgi:hypothetical protein
MIVPLSSSSSTSSFFLNTIFSLPPKPLIALSPTSDYDDGGASARHLDCRPFYGREPQTFS